MPAPNEFVSHLLDLLSPLRDVTARAMFGGWGFYHGGKMFALVAYDTFYVKVDEVSRPEFERAGLKPFVYGTKSGQRSVMSYHTVPTVALDSAELLSEWAQKGIDASRRAATAPKRRRKQG
jgi:DNA transformation protein and related proteins